MTTNIDLRGITWNHTRGYLPMVATAQRFHELNPHIRIRWDLRSLQAFADKPLEELVQSYDVLVIDHPSVGRAADGKLLLPLDEHLPHSFLQDQSAQSVGGSHASYDYAGHQWALAIDAATPVAGWRSDILDRHNISVPSTWDEVIELARQGLVIVPGLAIDCLMALYAICLACGEEPFQTHTKFVGPETGIEAIRMLQDLLNLCDPACLTRNPILTWQLLASSTTVAYCPFAYGYSNYSRRGYADHILEAGPVVSLDAANTASPQRQPIRTTLGGTGLAVSSSSKHREVALAYAQFVADEKCQSTLYFDAGGQPGHRKAWLDAETNRRANNFFLNTLPMLDNAYVRPRFNGYLHFQDRAAPIVHRFLTSGGDPRAVFETLDSLLAESYQHAGKAAR